mgnify:CR=1 FL=1
MEKFGKVIVKLRIPILVLSILLLIPSAIGYVNTRVNYDILYYLPDEIETMQGQDILLDDFGKGAYAMVVVDGMNKSNVSKLVKKVEGVDHVASVISYSGIVGDDVPSEILPDKFRSYFENEDSGATLFAIFFDDTTSSDDTMKAIQEVRDVTDNQCYIAGMSAVVTDTKTMAEKETPFYVLVAVVLVCIVLAIFMDSFLVPVFFMLSIGMAIVYNLGSNYFLGEVSYITKALAAVLQLGVTLDYSIFLWHSYKEAKEETPDNHQEAMAVAIGNTLTSVVGSSITTVAGFIALCFMSFTLGLDLGVVMAKGVALGVICTIVILPALILTFDQQVEKYKHRTIVPKLTKLSYFVSKHAMPIVVVFLVLLVPFVVAQQKTEVYYTLFDSLPQDLTGIVGTNKLGEDFGMTTSHFILVDEDLTATQVSDLCDELKDVDGITQVVSLDSVTGPGFQTELLPDSVTEILQSGGYKLILANSSYKTGTNAINNQLTEMNDLIKAVDPNGVITGEGAMTKDLIEVADVDFKNVNVWSIMAVAAIILISFRSLSIPVLLVASIEAAISINMGIPYFTGTQLPFIASIVIGTIQLGATVDYSILMTTRYHEERSYGRTPREAAQQSLEHCSQSILTSGLTFFAATVGVAAISKMELLQSICRLISRGALISMAVILVVLPAALMLLDWVIRHTTMHWLVPESSNAKKSDKE